MPLELISSIAGAAASVLVGLAALLSAYFVAKSRRGVGLEGFEAQVEELRERLSTPADGGDGPQRQYLLLREYHAQGLAQSKISFWFSLMFAAIGFAVIVSAIFTLQPSASISQQGRTLLALVAGTIIDAVAALFFVQSNKARQLMVDFFDRLRSDRKLEESLKLAAGIEDPELRARLHALLALSFAEIKQADGFLISLLGIQSLASEVQKEVPGE